jgi:hypothetical protein
MSRDRGSVREIDWLEVFPWLGLARTVALAWAPSKLLLALLGLTLTAAGWSGISRLYAHGRPRDAVIDRQAAAYKRLDPWDQPPPVDVAELAKGDGAGRFLEGGASAGQSLARLPAYYTLPFWQMFDRDSRWPGFSMAALCALWLLAVWAFCGGAITRLAAVRLAQDRRVGFLQACRHAIGKWVSYFAGPLFPLGGVVLLVMLASFAGWVSRLDVGFVVVAAVWPLGLIFALICAVLLVAALFGWPLMWSAVSTESSDAFDSFNRSFSYVTQRPFHLAFYVLVAGLMGAAAWVAVAAIGELAIYLVSWGVTWGSGPTRAEEIFAAAQAPMASASRVGLTTGGTLVSVWSGLVRLLVLAYGHSFLWTAASGVYLLLRRDTDATPLDEVYLDSAEDPYGLPPVKRDAQGVTVLDESQPQPAGAE